MGPVFASITLSNPVNEFLRQLETKCLVDSGATYLCIPAHVANQLELKELQYRKQTPVRPYACKAANTKSKAYEETPQQHGGTRTWHISKLFRYATGKHPGY